MAVPIPTFAVHTIPITALITAIKTTSITTFITTILGPCCHFLLSNQRYILLCLPFKESLETAIIFLYLLVFFHLFIFIYIRAADRFNIGWNKKASGKGKY